MMIFNSSCVCYTVGYKGLAYRSCTFTWCPFIQWSSNDYNHAQWQSCTLHITFVFVNALKLYCFFSFYDIILCVCFFIHVKVYCVLLFVQSSESTELDGKLGLKIKTTTTTSTTTTDNNNSCCCCYYYYYFLVHMAFDGLPVGYWVPDQVPCS